MLLIYQTEKEAQGLGGYDISISYRDVTGYHGNCLIRLPPGDASM